MLGIVGAHHTSFTVTDLERSLAFFRDVLEFEVVGSREIHDDYFGQIVGLPGSAVKAALIRIPGGHHVELFQYLEPQGTGVAPRPCDPGSTHLSLVTQDLAALYQVLRSRGAQFVSAPVLITAGPNRGGLGVYLRDPNGILLELFQLPSPDHS
jgi:catechol 2,3-dioxygenase-like lactoylglutathione lyase family enzyme